MEEIIIDNTWMEHLDKNEPYETLRRKRLLKKGEVTIVVQAYGRPDKTKNCLDSIEKYTQDIDYELILLDNGTENDEILNLFRSVNHTNTKIVRFEMNNYGIISLNAVYGMIETEYVVTVFNDIIVTNNWLRNLLICASSIPEAGMILPKSSNISNLQQVDIGEWNTIDEMQALAKKYNVSNPLLWEERIRLIPTATLYRTEIFDQVGKYDVGFCFDFGDDDFSFRVRRAGYKLIVAGDTYVHHDHVHVYTNQGDYDKAKSLIDIGRASFRKKYNGIDAWDDSVYLLSSYFGGYIPSKSAGINVLAIEPKCGMPILSVKNYLRRNGVENVNVSAYSSEYRYETDLLSVCDDVKVESIDKLTYFCPRHWYDIVTLTEPINKFDKPIQVLTDATDLVKKNSGVLIFALDNVGDIRNFLYEVGQVDNRNQDMPRLLYLEDVVEICKYKKANGINVVKQYHNVESTLKKQVVDAVQKIPFVTESAWDKLLIERYWIAVKC